MQRLMLAMLALVFLATGCGEDGPVEGVFEAVGLSENVDVEAPPGPATVDDVLARLGDDGFNGIVLIDQGGRLQVAPMGGVDGPDGPAIDEDTVFDIGSITKQFTGAAILRLEMDGLLSVDDRLGRHLPDAGPGLADLTLHQLLTHTAGLPDGIGDDYEPIDAAAFLTRAEDAAGEPGAYRYSNVGYSLLGMVIEATTGESYETYLRDVFFEPLGMDATGYVLPDFAPGTVAAGYDGAARLGLPNEAPWADDGPYWHLRANGGLLSTAADMRRWNAALDGDEILSADARAKLFDRYVEEGEGAGTYYGYGWVSFPLDDGGWFHGHNGGNGIFFADLLRLPTQDTLIFLASNHAGADEDAAFRIAEALVEGGVGAACLAPADPTSFPAQTDFPETPTGEAAEAFVEVLTTDDDGQRRDFVERHVADDLARGLSTEEQTAELALLGQEFLGYTVEMVHVEDARRLHAVMTAADGGRLILSVAGAEADPARLHCVEISA